MAPNEKVMFVCSSKSKESQVSTNFNLGVCFMTQTTIPETKFLSQKLLLNNLSVYFGKDSPQNISSIKEGIWGKISMSYFTINILMTTIYFQNLQGQRPKFHFNKFKTKYGVHSYKNPIQLYSIFQDI